MLSHRAYDEPTKTPEAFPLFAESGDARADQTGAEVGWTPVVFSAIMSASVCLETVMDCPNCGVYNPDERNVCWRCDQDLPKPEKPKKPVDPAKRMRQMWMIVGVVLVLWILLTWLLPLLLGGGAPGS
jgi:predicted nucleic acid-binding Zn ribbon protein